MERWRDGEMERERGGEREKEIDVSLSLYLSLPLLPLKEEFFHYHKLWDSLDYGEKVNKSDTI